MRLKVILLALVMGLAGCASQSGSGGQGLYGLIPAIAEPKEAREYGDFLTARFANLSHDPGVAADRFAAQARRDQGDIEAVENAVTAYLASGRFEKAAEYAVKARRFAFEDAPMSRMTAAVDAFQDLRFDEVHAMLQDTEPAPFLNLLEQGLDAWALAATGQTNEALLVFDSLHNQSAMLSGLAKYHQGLICLNARLDSEAMAYFDSAWAEGVRLPAAVDAYARLTAFRGDRDKAHAIVDEFHSNLGDNPLMDQLKKELDSDAAIKRPKVGPSRGAAIALMAPTAALVRQTRTDIAAIYFQFVIALDPSQHAARILSADALERTERREDAIALLSGVPDNSVYAGAVAARKAWLLVQLGRDDEAYAAAEKAIAVQPGRSIMMQAGDLFSALERYDRAEAVFSQVIANDQARQRHDWRAIFARGAARERQGDWKAAERDLLRALELSPEQPEVLNYLGYSWIDRNINIDDAFDLIRAAVRRRPNAGYIVDSLGWAYYRVGRYYDAVLHLERAAALDPGDATINDHLGDAYWQAGHYDLARYQWQRVLEFEPDKELAKKVREKLDTGLPLLNSLVH